MRGTSSYNSFFPPKPTFSVNQIPYLTGRVVIVTGDNVGIRYELVKVNIFDLPLDDRPPDDVIVQVLLQHNAMVYLAARSKQKAEAAIASLALELSSLTSINSARKDFDLQWGTNVVGPWLFTEHLIPALLAGVQTSPGHHARVIFTASSSGAYLETLHYDTFKEGPARQKMSGQMLYCQSKLGNVVVARQFAKRYADKGIIAISLNPGNIRSELQRNASKLSRLIIDRLFCYPTPYGTLTPLFAGTMPEALNHNGEFIIPFARLGRCRAEAYDDAFGQRLWKWLQDKTKQFRE